MDSAQTVDFKRNQWSAATGADSGILFSLTQINAQSSTMRADSSSMRSPT